MQNQQELKKAKRTVPAPAVDEINGEHPLILAQPPLDKEKKELQAILSVPTGSIGTLRKEEP